MVSLRLQAVLLGLVLALGLGLAPTVAASIPDTQGIADDLRSRLSEPRPELDVSEPIRAAGDDPSLPETRVRGFRLFDSLSRPGYNRVSRENATGSTFGLWGIRVGPVQKGLWTDPVTGAAYARARWYDARNGVFLTEDPMGAIDSPNLYAFVGHHPNLGVDPLGLCEGDRWAKALGIGCAEGQDDAGVIGEFALGVGEGVLGLVEDTVVGAWETGKLIVQVGPVDAAKIMGQGLKQSIQQAPERALAWLEMMNNASDEEAAREFGRGFGRAGTAVATGGGAAVGGLKLAKRGRASGRNGRGLGDAETSPWLNDPRPGVAEHLERFRGGGSYLLPEFAVKNFVEGKKFIGRPGGQFITTHSAMDKLMREAAGDLGIVKARLGIPSDQWNERLYRVDVHDPLLWNARLPSGLEPGANDFFRWGGYTSGGGPEIVITPFPAAGARVTPTDIRP